MADLLATAVDSKKNSTIAVEDIIISSDEDLDICDQDSVASSVDSTAEEMFIDGLDPVLDRWVLLHLFFVCFFKLL